MAERREIVKDGAITLTITTNKDFSQLLSFDCTQKGLILANNAKGENISSVLQGQVTQLLAKYKKLPKEERAACQVYIHSTVKEFLEEKYEIQPLIQVILHQVSNTNKKILPSLKLKEGSIGGGLGKEETQCSAD